jgi:glycosyltransferase involved in cell wall biosynthesis/peptidoglycan/xylan/chitin deacetylase (PgdA/CDA1 family)
VSSQDGSEDAVRSLPRLSVVVPTHQRRDLVLKLLDKLDLQDTKHPFEAIVVIDGSTDGTIEAIRSRVYAFPFRVIEQDNRGAATARNRGAALARGDVMLFLDDDMEPHPALVGVHLAAHDAGADAVMGATPLHPDSPDNIMARSVGKWADELRQRCGQPGYRLGPEDIFTGQFSIRRSHFNELGGFDERFTAGGTFGNEDVDFGYRLIASGSKVTFEPDAISFQRYVVSAREFLPRWTQVGDADMTIARLHLNLPSHSRAALLRSTPRSSIARAVVRLPALARVLVTPFRMLAIRLVDGGRMDGFTRRLYAKVRLVHYWLGVARVGGPLDGEIVRILCWHAIADLASDPVLRDYGVPPTTFRAQLESLQKAGWAFLTADEFLGFIGSKGKVPRRSVLLTFDDCYADLATEAQPILAVHRAAAVAFAVSGRVGDWNRWDIDQGLSPQPLANREVLLELAMTGLEIGAHSRTHPRLTRLDDRELEEETAGSRDDLAEMGFPAPRLFAYPHGDHDRRVEDAVRAAGFESAFTVVPGKANRNLDEFAIPRLEVWPHDTGLRFLRKVRRGGPESSLELRARRMWTSLRRILARPRR